MGDIVPSGKTIGSPGGKKKIMYIGICILYLWYQSYMWKAIRKSCPKKLFKGAKLEKKKKKIKKHSFKLIGFSYVYGTQLPP